MAYESLREFMGKLEAAGELVRVTEPVSTVLEMTEIQSRLLPGGPAVLFENADPRRRRALDHAVPGQPVRHGQARGHGRDPGGQARAPPAAELREVGELLAFLRQPEPPRGLKDAWDMLPLAKTVMSMRPEDREDARRCRRWC